MRTATPTPTEKNNNKYKDCTHKCIELDSCAELSLKLERDKIFSGVLRAART